MLFVYSNYVFYPTKENYTIFGQTNRDYWNFIHSIEKEKFHGFEI